MRFKKVKKEKVVSAFSLGIVKSRIGNGYSANTPLKIKGRPIASKIEKLARLSEPRQFLSSVLMLQFFQDQRPDIIHIDPGLKNGKDIRII
jgi:hypothetical protein